MTVGRGEGSQATPRYSVCGIPSRYVIFDARVAAALNAVQMINGRPLRIRFPIPSGQNATIKKFAKLVKEHKAQYDVPKKEAYDTYLRTLAEVAKRLDRVDLYRIEMILFGLATRLARQLLSARQGRLTPASAPKSLHYFQENQE